MANNKRSVKVNIEYSDGKKHSFKGDVLVLAVGETDGGGVMSDVQVMGDLPKLGASLASVFYGLAQSEGDIIYDYLNEVLRQSREKYKNSPHKTPEQKNVLKALLKELLRELD